MPDTTTKPTERVCLGELTFKGMRVKMEQDYSGGAVLTFGFGKYDYLADHESYAAMTVGNLSSGVLRTIGKTFGAAADLLDSMAEPKAPEVEEPPFGMGVRG